MGKRRLRGDWVPGSFPTENTLVGKLTLFAAAIIYGADYLAGDAARTSWRLSVVESAAPLAVWGTMFILAGALGFVSVLLRRSTGVFLSHTLGMTLFIALGVGVLIDVWYRVGPRNEHPWFVVAAVVLGGLIWYIVYRYSTWRYAEIVTAGIIIATILGLGATHWDGARSGVLLITVGIINGVMALGTASASRQRELYLELAHVERSDHDRPEQPT